MRAFTIKVKETAECVDACTIIGHVELSLRQGNTTAFPVVELGTVNKRPDETEVGHLPERFFKINFKSKRSPEPPSHFSDIRISAMDDKGRRFGLWDPNYISEDDAGMAFIYLAPVSPLTRARFHDANTLKYDGVLIEGYQYHPEKRVNKLGEDRWTFSCPSILFAEKDQTYQIDWYDLEEEAVKETIFHFDGQSIIIDAVNTLTKAPNKVEEGQVEFLESAEAFKRDAKRYRDKEEQKRREKEQKKKKDSESRIVRSVGDKVFTSIDLTGVNVKDVIQQAEESEEE